MAPAVVAFVLVAALANVQGWGHSIWGIAALAGLFFVMRDMPSHWRTLILQVWFIVSIAMAALAFGQPLIPHALAPEPFGIGRSRGIFGSANFLGDYAALNLFVLAYLWPKITEMPRLAVACNIFMLVASQSRGALLATLAGCLVLFCNRPRVLLATLLPGAVVMIGLCAMRQIHDARADLWHMGLTVGLMRPLLGWGLGGASIAWAHDGTLTLNMNRYYNVPLEWFIATGFAGVAIAVALLATGLKAACGLCPPKRRAALAFYAAWIVSGLTMFIRPETSIALFAMLGIVASEYRNPARHAVVADDNQPPLDSGVRAGGAD